MPRFYGIPTPENIQLGSDGSASCTSTTGLPSVANVAQLLLTLLPAGTPSVPAPLRYAIARGLEAVEAPPFASLGEFSSALERFEMGARRDVLRGVLQRGARPSRPIATGIAVAPAPTPVTPPAAGRSPVALRPTVVPSRPTLVVRKPAASSNELLPPIAATPPMFRSVGADGEAGSPVHSSRRWALAAAAALVASFTVGYVIGDGITDRRAATQSSRSARVSAGVSAAARAANDSAANPAEVEPRDEIVRVPHTPSADEIVPPPAAARADALANAPTGPVERVGEQVRAIQAVRATNANAFSPAFASDGTAICFHTGGERDARSTIEAATTGSQTGEDLRTKQPQVPEPVMVNTPVPTLLRQQVDRWARTWLTAKFSRLLELRARDPGPFNYPTEVFSEWRGKAFYLNVRYRARSRKVEDDFVVRHTRMTLTGFGRFDLAYFRHTDKWFTVYRGLTAADCFREIEENEIFWPTT